VTDPRKDRAKRLQALTLALTVALAVALGGIMWLSVTSLPYLATSPTTDPNFGALNACLLGAVPERLGFAVSRDVKRAAAWSTSKFIECAGTPPTATTYPLEGATLATYDASGALWVAASTLDGGVHGLSRLENGAFVSRGSFSPAAMVGTARGVIALEPQGQLIALAGDGSVSATRALPMQRDVHLISSIDGSLVALFGGGKFAVVNSTTLESTPAEVPCPVQHVWWRVEGPLLLVECVDISIELNALDSQSVLVDPRQRSRSTLTGPTGVYVQSCDVLPCIAEAPR
jgi:hypothetical protein